MALNSNTFHNMISNIDYSKLKKAPRKEEEETDEKDWTGVRKLFNSDYFKDGLNKAYNPNVKKVQYSEGIEPNTAWSMLQSGSLGGYPSGGMIGGSAGSRGSTVLREIGRNAAPVISGIKTLSDNAPTDIGEENKKLGPDGYTPEESARLFPDATAERPTRRVIPGSAPKEGEGTKVLPEDKEGGLEDDFVTSWLEKEIDDYVNYFETEDSALAALERSLDYLKKQEEYAVNEDDPNDPKDPKESREERMIRRRKQFKDLVDRAFRKRYRERDNELNGAAREAEREAEDAASKLSKPGEKIDAKRTDILKNRKPQHRMSNTEASRTDYDHAMAAYNRNDVWSTSK